MSGEAEEVQPQQTAGARQNLVESLSGNMNGLPEPPDCALRGFFETTLLYVQEERSISRN